jgi:hypothetical protein
MTMSWFDGMLARRYIGEIMSESLVRRLALVRRTASTHPVTRYDAVTGMSMVLEEGRWIPSHESQVLAETKKADIEKGEDQKGS